MPTSSDLAERIKAGLKRQPTKQTDYTIVDLLMLAERPLNNVNKDKMRAYVKSEIAAGRMVAGRGQRPSWAGNAVSVPVVFIVE